MIKEFQGKYRFLSNFYPVEVEYEGETYPTVEHAYQASKTTNLSYRIWIKKAPTPGKAKSLGRQAPVRSDWDEIKVLVMRNLLVKKFRNPLLRKRLVKTYPERIQEGNYWNDTFWGVNLRTGEGQNNLGKILMHIRNNIVNCEEKEDK